MERKAERPPGVAISLENVVVSYSDSKQSPKTRCKQERERPYLFSRRRNRSAFLRATLPIPPTLCASFFATSAAFFACSTALSAACVACSGSLSDISLRRERVGMGSRV